MLKVYFTAATSYNGELALLYKSVIDTIKKNRLKIISGKQIVDKKLRERDTLLSSDEIFKREKRLIDEADFVIAEVSKPSLGVGSEIVYALTEDKPVLAIVHTGYEDKISPIIAGNPSDHLFLEYYSRNNLDKKIKKTIKYIKTLNRFCGSSGKFIVVDGGNGSGKTTQAQLLVQYLKQKNIPVKYYDFPQYYHSFHGKTIGKFLRGEFGDIKQVSPYLVSLAFALDRASVKKEMDSFLKKGGFIVANRYATSNMAHQGAKFDSLKERDDYLKWVYELEYKVHKIPKEDKVIYLYVPWKVGMTLSQQKGERKYLNGQTLDIEEKDIKNRVKSEELYLYLAKKYKHWVKIDCVEKGKLLSKEKIQEKILNVLKEYLR